MKGIMKLESYTFVQMVSAMDSKEWGWDLCTR